MVSLNPFYRYTIQRYCRTLDDIVDGRHCQYESWTVSELFATEVNILEPPREVVAELSSGQRYRLYDEEDIRLWRGSTAKRDIISNIAGRIGERLTFLLLKGFVQKCIEHSREAGYAGTTGWVVRERRKHDGKPFHKHVVQWNDHYLLKFDRRTTFVLLQKASRGRQLLYVEEKESVQKSEIDGLAYFTLRRDKEEEGKHYLLVTEVKTASRKSSIPNYLRAGSGRKESIEERLFTPLRSLFPRHNLVYVIAGYEHSLFMGQEGRKVLRPRGPEMMEKLFSSGVQTVFLPLPSTVNISALAELFYSQLLNFRTTSVT